MTPQLKDVNAAWQGSDKKDAGDKIKQGFQKAKGAAAAAKREASQLAEPLSDESPIAADAAGSKVAKVLSGFLVIC